MRSGNLVMGGCLLACMSLFASAQSNVDRSFKAVSKNCDDVQWSQAALERYPKIGSACQAVEERDGKKYVKFQAEVERNIDRGKQLRLKFKKGNTLTLTPPPDTHLYVNDKPTPVASLQRGDELTFYIAEDRLAAQFYAQNQTPATTTTYVIVPIVYEEVYEVAQEDEQTAATLPATASRLPLVALSGLALMGVGLVLGVLRLIGRR